MCIKSSCTNCHSKSHCQEKSLRDEIDKLETYIANIRDAMKLVETVDDGTIACPEYASIVAIRVYDEKIKRISKLERTVEHLKRQNEDSKSENNEVMDELLKEIEEYKKLTEKLIKELEDSNKCLELAGEKIEKMKNCDNCKHNWKEYGGENSCELTWTAKRCCTRKLNFSNNFEDFWELG